MLSPKYRVNHALLETTLRISMCIHIAFAKHFGYRTTLVSPPGGWYRHLVVKTARFKYQFPKMIIMFLLINIFHSD